MLITKEYRRLNAELHQSNAAYGVSSSKWANTVCDIATKANLRTVLDYGCGKGMLQRTLFGDATEWPHPFTLFEYDPAIPAKMDGRRQCQFVVCTDVLEHIEPELLPSVLDDLRALSLNMAFLTVATRPAKKILPDGRNAHLIQQPAKWWLPQLMERWDLMSFTNRGGEFMALLQCQA